jgi:hypothetical protein
MMAKQKVCVKHPANLPDQDGVQSSWLPTCTQCNYLAVKLSRILKYPSAQHSTVQYSTVPCNAATPPFHLSTYPQGTVSLPCIYWALPTSVVEAEAT